MENIKEMMKKIEGEDKIACNDENCDSCLSEEQGAGLFCKEGFYERKGECFQGKELY